LSLILHRLVNRAIRRVNLFYLTIFSLEFDMTAMIFFINLECDVGAMKLMHVSYK